MAWLGKDVSGVPPMSHRAAKLIERTSATMYHVGCCLQLKAPATHTMPTTLCLSSSIPASPTRRLSHAPRLQGMPEQMWDEEIDVGHPLSAPPAAVRTRHGRRSLGDVLQTQTLTSSTIAAAPPAARMPSKLVGLMSPPPSVLSSALLMEMMADKASLDECCWYVGALERSLTEKLLARWPSGTFCIRRSHGAPVFSLKFVTGDKRFFHVRIQEEAGVRLTACWRWRIGNRLCLVRQARTSHCYSPPFPLHLTRTRYFHSPTPSHFPRCRGWLSSILCTHLFFWHESRSHAASLNALYQACPSWSLSQCCGECE